MNTQPLEERINPYSVISDHHDHLRNPRILQNMQRERAIVWHSSLGTYSHQEQRETKFGLHLLVHCENGKTLEITYRHMPDIDDLFRVLGVKTLEGLTGKSVLAYVRIDEKTKSESLYGLSPIKS